ncbi:hypothetical protein COOONC_27855 [Cooperia oncophora]
MKAPFDSMRRIFASEEDLKRSISSLHTLQNGHFEKYVDRLEGILPDLLKWDRLDNLADDLGMDRVLCHGDFYPMNTLWKKDDEGFNLAAVIDYQCSRVN